MKVLRQISPVIFTLLLPLVVTSSPSEFIPLVCHEGFNASIGGIPIYFWSENRCESGASCVVQETSIASTSIKFAHATLRYGGCLPTQIERYLTCSTSSTPPIKFEELKQLAEIMDNKLLSLTFELHLNPQKHLARFLSKGKGISEFYEGVLNLLESIGYSRNKIKNPLKNLIQGKREDFSENRNDLLRVMALDNDATEKFSFSLEAFLLRFSDGFELPDTLSEVIELLPGLTYPLLNSVGVEVDSIVDDLSSLLDSSGEIPSELSCSSSVPIFYILQAMVLGLERPSDREANTIMYKAAQNITERCLSVYPSNVQFKRIKFAINGLHEAAEESYKCGLGSRKCRMKLRKALQNIPRRFYRRYPTSDNGTVADALRDFYMNYVMAMNDVRERPMAYVGSIFGHIVNKTNEKLLKVIRMMQDSYSREKNFVTSCKEFHCFTNLCNSHEAFAESHDKVTLRHSERRTEL